MSERNTPADSADEHSTTTTKKVAGKVNPVQSAIEAIEDDVPVEVFRRLSHMKEAIGAIETWADDADPNDTDALVGAKTIVSTERERAVIFDRRYPTATPTSCRSSITPQSV